MKTVLRTDMASKDFIKEKKKPEDISNPPVPDL